ncbi:Ku protein [Actinacidiphila sp. bgisy160]|uniref:Ku protein n=1 Tax=Actinacidiphila sp. bgisy160 TaxID=3413796 RepID=UPI003D765374
MWKGAIGFGLVSIPVKLYAATEEHGVSLHQVHAEDGGSLGVRAVPANDGPNLCSSAPA